MNIFIRCQRNLGKEWKNNQKKDGVAKRSTPAIRFGKELVYLVHQALDPEGSGREGGGRGDQDGEYM